MTVKEMECVYSAIWHAKEIIEKLASTEVLEFEDKDFEKMFYDLNRMNITITKKIARAERAIAK